MSLYPKNTPIAAFLWIITLTVQSILHFHVLRATSPSIIDTASLSSTQGVIVPLSTSSQSWIASSAGDFNGDSFEDIILAQYAYSSSSGIVYVIFGTANGIPNIDLTTITTMSYPQGIQISGVSGIGLGYSVAGLGDVNGDNIDDIIIGTNANTYKVHVIFGKNGPLSNINIATATDISTTNQGITITSPYKTSIVSSAGDFNGDGTNDFMVSFPTAASNQGVTYVIFGNKNGLSSLDLNIPIAPTQGFQIMGTPNSRLGASLSKAGDVSGDGIDDIMVGTTTSGGMVIIIYGTKALTSTVQAGALLPNQGITITGSTSSIIGSVNTISCAGDLNNDGVDDIALGAPAYGTSPTASGMIYIIYGQKGGFSADIILSPTSSWNGFKITGERQTSWGFGKSIASADINGDGLSDLIVGALKASGSAGSATGRAYVFFGNKNGFKDIDLANPPSPQVLAIYGKVAYDNMGLISSSAKDLNKDGVNDFISLGMQNAYVFYGGACDSLTQCDSSSLSPICYASKGCVCGETSLYFQENACVSECSEGYYAYTSICETCPTGCSSCTSASTCQSCSYGYVLKGTSCVSACPTGYHLEGQTCQSDDVSGLSQAQTIGSIAGTTQVAGSATLAAASLVSANDPGSATASTLAKMLQYIQFLDIPYSQRLGLTFKKHNSTYGPYGIGPKMPEKLQLELPFHIIPYQFIEYHVHSNFMINFWDSMIFLSIIIGMLLFVILIELSIAKIKKKLYPIILMVRLLVQNFFLMQFYNVFGDILLFLILDFKKVMLVNSQAVLSFCLAIFFLCMGCAILAWHVYILMTLFKLRKSSSLDSKSEELEKKYHGSTALFVHFKGNSRMSQSFLLVFVLRNCLFSLILALLSDYPLFQAIIIFIMNIFIILYLLVQRPFKNIINLFQHITCEVFLLIVNTCVLILAQIDFGEASSYLLRDRICEVIIYASLMFGFVPQIFLGLKIVAAGILWYTEYRKKSSNKNSAKMPQLTIKNRLQKGDSSTTLSSQNKSLNESSIGLKIVHDISNIVLLDGEASFTKTPSPRNFFIKNKEMRVLSGSNNSQDITLQGPMNNFKQIRNYNQQWVPQQTDISSSGILEQQAPKNSGIVRNVKDIARKMGIGQSHLPKWRIARRIFKSDPKQK